MILWLNVWNKEILTLRNFFVVTKKFLKAKFDYSTLSRFEYYMKSNHIISMVNTYELLLEKCSQGKYVLDNLQTPRKSSPTMYYWLQYIANHEEMFVVHSLKILVLKGWNIIFSLDYSWSEFGLETV